jgi:hypothetical protein
VRKKPLKKGAPLMLVEAVQGAFTFDVYIFYEKIHTKGV